MALPAWMDKAREVRKKALQKEVRELFLQPIFKGKEVVLEYHDLELVESDDKELNAIIRKSGVPTSLRTSEYKNWGGVSPKVLYIRGVIARSRKDKTIRRFIALQVWGENGIEYHNQITSIHLLFARNFYAPLAQSSWMHTKEVKASTLNARLNGIADVRVERVDGKAFSVLAPIGLEVYDCMGWTKKGKAK